jgi:signal transduction histidine kinase
MSVIRKRSNSDDEALLALRGVCHELRPPMATLTALVRALEQQPPGSHRPDLLGLALAHADHAQAVLREAASVATGLTGPADAPVPLGVVLPEVAATVPGDRLTVAAGLAAGRWPVPGQHTRQILTNLVTNAARHTSGRIRLGARSGLRRLRLTVADEGGLTPGLLRALHRRTAPPDDDGLGLWLVRHLAATHGGRVRARAIRPSGLVMEVVLPRYRRAR